jgi:FtsP/CotA-like multicopper oxidase with cupredoxin domain
MAVVEYTQRMHTDLAKATTLRGYVQIDPVATDARAGIVGNAGVSPAGSKAIPLFQLDGVTPVLISRPSIAPAAINGFEQVQAVAVDKPAYLGPTLVAQHDIPTRIKFYNGLPAGHGYTDAAGLWHREGDLFIPVDHTLFGGGDGQTPAGFKDLLCGDVLAGPNNIGDPTLSACAGGLNADGSNTPLGYVHVPKFELYTENREELHLHGGDNPWISDGHPHQWITPAADELNAAEAPNYQRGDIAYNVPDMANAGPGAVTYYWPNGQSGRLLFFHDHATGLTRLNVYAGTAAGYLLTDASERAINNFVAGEIPLVIQDKTFVPRDILTEDAKWDTTHWGQEGDLWFPHVYETNQDPLSADATNPVGRWDGASFFWPVFPQNYATPSGEYGSVSTTPESFMDTPIVNGMAYPTMTVDPKAYRFRILGVGNDRMLNLNLFVADNIAGTPVPNSEVKMVPFNSPNGPTQVTYACPDGLSPGQTVGTVNINGTILKAGYTESGPSSSGITQYNVSFPCAGGLIDTGWGQADNRPGGVPDPATMGPDIIRIGNEGGLFQQSVVIPPTPIDYEYNKRSVTVLNVLERGLWLGPAERADVIIDFSQYAGKTLILYNDSGAPVPAGDPRIDYYTNDGDQTGAGGAPNTLAGYGPNTRTIMQINVAPSAPAAPLDLVALNAQLLQAYVATQPKPVVPTPEYAPMAAASVPVFVANAPYEHIYTGSIYLNKYNALNIPSAPEAFNYTPAPVCNTTSNCLTALRVIRQRVNGGLVQAAVGQPVNAYVESKAIQELFEADYGRMNATLGVELPFTNVTVQTTIPLGYVDPATETIAQGETQFWKITHNGVDSHPVHFHFINVQVINRVGWDGTIKTIPADEVGWKETVKMHPLEDVIVAVRAKSAPPTPFGMPHSYRQPAPSQLATDNHGITQIDPATGNAPAVPYTNNAVDYGSEYVWHCHILGHEENDFMRPFIFKAQEVLTPAFAVTTATANVAGITVTWNDPTPIPVPLTAYDSINAPNGFLGNPNNEIGFRVERADVVGGVAGAYVPVAGGLHVFNAITRPINAPANSVSYLDPAANGAALPTPAAPTLTAQTASSVTLTLPALPQQATGYDVYRDGVLLATNQPAGVYIDATVVAGQSYTYTIMAMATAAGIAPEYSYRVVAVTAAGDTVSTNAMNVPGVNPSNSLLSAATAVLMVPVAPTVTVTNPAVNSLQVQWTPVLALPAVSGYLVSIDGAAPVAAASPDVVTGLAANTSYSFTVAAVNATGTGALSAPATGLTLPAAPGALTTAAVTASSIALSWTAPANNLGLNYTVLGLPIGATQTVVGTTAMIAGLGPNSVYSFTVVGNNASGAGAPSNAASALTLPVAPSGLTATAASPTDVTLAWTASLNGAASYTVQYSANGGASWTSLAPLAGTGMTVTGLLPSTSYLFQVTANNATGSSAPSGQATATTPATLTAPGIPGCCTATLPTSTSVTINWIAPATGPATSYTMQRATNATFTRGLQTTLNVIGTNLAFTGLNPNATYYFRVLAVNAVGSSAYSATFSFQPPAPPAPPAAPAATASAVSTSAPTITLALPAPVAGVTLTIYQQSRTGGGTPWSVASVVATSVTATSWTSAALTPDMQYRYSLVAVNASGSSANGPNSNNVTVRQLANAPTGLTAANLPAATPGVGTRSVNLNWALGVSNGTTVTGVRVLRSLGSVLAAPITTNNMGATAITRSVNGLARATTYTFQVEAVTAGGGNGSTTVTITTLP